MAGGACTAPSARGRTGARSSDHQLVVAAQAGDGAACEALVHRHAPRATRVARRMLDCPSDAEDASQEALLSAWRALGRFRADAAFATWLHRIVINHCLNFQAGRPPTLELHDAAVPRVAGPEVIAEQRAAAAAALRAVVRLPEPQGRAYALRELRGCTYAEMSAVTGEPIATMKTRVHRARRSISETLVVS